jgi:hypothetical protein
LAKLASRAASLKKKPSTTSAHAQKQKEKKVSKERRKLSYSPSPSSSSSSFVSTDAENASILDFDSTSLETVGNIIVQGSNRGAPIDRETKSFFEQRFGYDFSRVRIHDDDSATSGARAIGADAYTVGEDIFFAKGMYRPDTLQGKLLLAHELTHVVQQQQLRRLQQRTIPSELASFSFDKRTTILTTENDPAESEAKKISEQIVFSAKSRSLDGVVSVTNLREGGEEGRRIISRQISRSAPLSRLLNPIQGQHLVFSVVEVIVRSLQDDPTDSLGSVRRQLAGLSPALRQNVLDQLHNRLSSTQWDLVQQLMQAVLPVQEEAVGETAQEIAATPQTESEERGALRREEESELEEQEEGKEGSEGQGMRSNEEVEGERQEGEESEEKKTHDEFQRTEEAQREETEKQLEQTGEQKEQEGEIIPEVPQLEASAAEAEGQPPAAAEQAAVAQAPTPAASAAAIASQPIAVASIPEPPGIGAVSAEPEEVAAESVGVEEEEEEEAEQGIQSEREQAIRGQSEESEAIPSIGQPSPPPVPLPESSIEQEQERLPPAEQLPVTESTAVDESPAPLQLPQAAEAAPITTMPEAAAEEEAEERSSLPSASIETEAEIPQVIAEESESRPYIAADSKGGTTTTTSPRSDMPISPETTDEQEVTGEINGTSNAEPEGASLGGGGGGGGGGGTPIEEPQKAAIPDVSSQEPSEALSSIGSIPPAHMLSAMSGVTASVSNTVGEKRNELASSPPQIDRPSGLRPGEAGEEDITGAGGGGGGPRQTERVPQGEDVATPEPEPLEGMAAASVAESIPVPSVSGDPQGQMSAAEVGRVREAVDELPTTDPTLEVTAGPAPQVELEGNADPASVDEQHVEIRTSMLESAVQGRHDAVQPMGEQEIYPEVPHETLTAQISQGQGEGGGGAAAAAAPAQAAPAAAGMQGAGGGGGGGGGIGGDTEDAVSIIAQEQHGQEISSSIVDARSQVVARQQEHAEQVTEANETSRQEIDGLVQGSAAEQLEERRGAIGEVSESRREWTREQNELLDSSSEEAQTARTQGRSQVSTERREANTQSAARTREGNREAAAARQQAEQTAARERQRAKNDTSSEGFFGWLASKVKSFFNAIKQAIKDAFERARKAVKAAIEKAKNLATSLIEAARKRIVDFIKAAGDALIAIGDHVLAAFPEMRDRFRSAIQERVRRAVDKVNEVADRLKEGVQKALDALGAAVDAALGLLERGMLAAVDAVSSVVQGAIQAARAVVQAIAAFAALIKDIAANPGQWIRNLGAAVVDGIQNHLWRALKTAVKEWFSQKVEQVLGLGMAVWEMLRKGNISLSAVAKMAWEGIKQAIPGILIRLLIEKLVSMIVPAAGAVMAIVEGIQAAWGTISRIIQAFEKFFVFLKAVKGGNAGPQFAEAVAAGAVAAIDFVSNWLLAKLMKAASKVAGRLKSLAARIGKSLRRVGRVIKRGIVGAGRALRRAARWVGRAAGRVGRILGSAVRRGRLGRLGRRIAARTRRMGRRIRRKWRRIRRKFAEKRKSPAERLAKAQREIPGKVSPWLRRGIPRFILSSMLALWNIGYRLRVLAAREESEGKRKIVAANSPEIDLVRGIIEIRGNRLLRLIHEIGNRYLQHSETRQTALDISAQRAQGLGREGSPILFPPGIGNEGQVIDVRESIKQREFGVKEHSEMAGIRVVDWLSPRVREEKPLPTVGRIEVTSIGSYTNILKILGNIRRDTGASEHQIGEAIQNISQGKPLPSIFGGTNTKYAQSLASVARLINVEGARGDAAVVFGNMLRSSAGSGILTPKEAFTLFPPRQEKAVASMRGLAEELNIQPQIPITTGKRRATRAQVTQQRQMQIEFLAMVIYNEMRAMNKNFLSETDVTKYIEGRWEQLFYSTRFPSSIQT